MLTLLLATWAVVGLIVFAMIMSALIGGAREQDAENLRGLEEMELRLDKRRGA